MKRLLLLIPVLLVASGCGSSAQTSDAKPILSHSARLGEVPMRLDVAGLHRIGRLAALDLRLINRSPYGGDAFSIDDTFSREGYDDLDGVLVIDRHSGRELATVSDPEADTTMIDIASGGSQQLRVAFPAPSGNAVDVLVPHFGLFRNVPVH